MRLNSTANVQTGLSIEALDASRLSIVTYIRPVNASNGCQSMRDIHTYYFHQWKSIHSLNTEFRPIDHLLRAQSKYY